MLARERFRPLPGARLKALKVFATFLLQIRVRIMRKNIGGTYCMMQTPEKGCDCDSLQFINIDRNLCTGCGLCKTICPTGAISGIIGQAHEIPHVEACLHCGICLTHCPEGAIYENYSWLNELEGRLKDNDVTCLALPAPAVRHSVGKKYFAKGIGSARLRGALNTLGFDHCVDVQFGADATIREEGNEFVRRLQQGGPWPLLSSCCPSWIRYAESFYPEILPSISTVKSPLMIAGRVAKKFIASERGFDPQKCYSVAITPCIAKKYEILRPEFGDKYRDIDAALTTREFEVLLEGLNYKLLPSLAQDRLGGESSSSAARFCVGGGVSEAILRHAEYALTGAIQLGNIGKKPERAGVTEISMKLDGMELRCVSVQGAQHFAQVCSDIMEKRKNWHFVEFMACPSGCVNGGGQPINIGA